MLLAAVGRAQPATATADTRLVFTAGPEQQPLAQKLAEHAPARLDALVRFLGAERFAEQPVQVVLASDDSLLGRRTPAWINGYARGDRDLVVLLTDRVQRFPHDSSLELLMHELSHVMIYRAAGAGDVPRWFNEGLAMLAANSWGIDAHSLVTWSLLRDAPDSLAALDRRFEGDASQIRNAYALAGALVRDLVQQEGTESVPRLLRELESGVDFSTAIWTVFGTSPEQLEQRFLRRLSIRYRWIPFLTSSVFLWLLITALALVAFQSRRQRDRELQENWRREEEALLVEVSRRSNVEREGRSKVERGPWIH